MSKVRIVVTGLGVVSPLGNDVKTTWESLLQQKSGIAQIQSYDASKFPTTIAAEVKNFNPLERIQDKKLLKQTVSFTNFAIAAADEALQDSGIKPTDKTADRWGCVVGSGMMTAEFSYWEKFQKNYAADGEIDIHKLQNDNRGFISITEFAKTQSNSGLGLLLQRYNIRGYTSSVHTACASGGQALGLALQAMRRGDCDSMLVGGFDSMINPIGLSSFCLLGALSTYNDKPETASRPFDLTRAGFVLGEGAAFLVLETEQHAKNRGAKIYAELAGEGNSLSSYRITDSHPNGDGAKQAIESALKDAEINSDEIDYINAHGTSTKMNDLSETNAIKSVFQHYKEVPTSSTKSQTGHLIAAAGALEGVLTVLSIHHGIMPMTKNLTTPDPECDLDYIVTRPREKNIKAAMSNSFGFGGSNSCIVFKHAEYQGGQSHD